MIATLKKLLGIEPAPDFGQLIVAGATILDVRSKGEYAQGHIKGSVNVPLDQLKSFIAKQKGKGKDKAIITCCASGMRSANAKSILKSNGFSQVYNGGGWTSLNRYL
ncbi:MAG: rhodanese-like domain-containing protein [Chitinophagales bacterium]|nr:rhodanese-like domain-containing protein [Chitinophagales bacterium]